MIYSLWGRLYSVFKNHKAFYLLIALLTFLVAVLYRNYLFGGKLFLFEDFGSDSVRVSLPTYLYLYDWFRNGMPLWSDKMGIGTSVLSHSEVIFDPFTYILFLFGRNSIIYMFIYQVVIKIILSGIFFWLFIGKYSKYKMSSYARMLGSISYAFGGYMIVTGQNYVFATIYVYLPLLLLGFEMWLQDRRKWLLVLTLSATAIYFYYFFYMTAIFFALYAIFRYFFTFQFQIKHFIQYIGTLIFYGLFSLGLTAFYWLPSLALTLHNVRLGASHHSLFTMLIPSQSLLNTVLGRLFSYDIFGGPANYMGYQDYFQLALYCSIFALLITPQLFHVKVKREKRAYIAFSILLLILLFVPFCAYMFNGFSTFSYRWAYILQFSFALFFALAADNIFHKKIISYKILLITLAVLFISAFSVLYFIYIAAGHKQFFGRSIKILVVDFALIAVYLSLIFGFFKTNQKVLIKVVIFILICAELIIFPRHFINDRLTTSPDPVKNRLGYFDYTNEAVDYLSKKDTSIYRIDKSYDSVISEYGKTPSDNEPMAQNYRGLTSYNSNNQPNYIRFIQSMGIFVKYPNYTPRKGTKPEDIKDENLNYINNVGNRHLLQSFLGVKYYLVKVNGIKSMLPTYYQYLTTLNGIKIYKNDNYLPLGFTLDKYITSGDFKKLNNQSKDVALFNFAVIDDQTSLFKSIHRGNVSDINKYNSQQKLNSLISNIRTNGFQIISYKDDDIKGKIKTSTNSILVFTIPYGSGWSATMDDHPIQIEKVDNGFIGVPVTAGKHSIELRYFPLGMRTGIIISFISILLLAILALYNNYIHEIILWKR